MLTFDEFITFVKSGTNTIIAMNRSYQPMLFIADEKGRLTIVEVPIFDDDAKIELSNGLPLILKASHAVYYAFACECWSARAEAGSEVSEKLLAGEIKVSELPLDDRTEIISLIACSNEKECVLWITTIREWEHQRKMDSWEKWPDTFKSRFLVQSW